MKSKFPGYVDNFLESQILEAKEIIVAFDTNILLNLYRVESSVSEDIISQIKYLIESDYFDVWLPHQVALEFNTLRKSTFRDKDKSVSLIASEFKKFKKQLEGLAKVGGKNGEIYPLKQELGEHFHNIDNIIKRYSSKASQGSKRDSIGSLLFELFDGIVGEPFNFEDLEQLQEEGDYRFKNRIPPGFDDDGKGSSYSYNGININAKYGDFILWQQLINYATQESKPLILVTGDTKPDWQSNEFHRVRPELITEFKLKTGQNFYALTLPNFERYFDKYLKRKLSVETTSEIQELNKKDKIGWLEDILMAFKHYKRPLSLKEIYKFVYDNSSRNFPATWEIIIRRTIYNHCSDVMAYLGKRDLFIKLDSGKYELR